MKNNEILFISSKDEDSLYNMDELIEAIDGKRSKTVSVVDANNPENAQMYTYNKFLEIFDNSGLDGFLV